MEHNNNNNNNSNFGDDDKYKSWYDSKKSNESEPLRENERYEEGVSYFRYGAKPSSSEPSDHAGIVEPRASARQEDTPEERTELIVPAAYQPMQAGELSGAGSAAPGSGLRGSGLHAGGASGRAQREGESFRQPKRSSWKSMFASFMAGVVVVGSLMFVSDRFDLFTVDQGVFNSSSPSSNEQSASSGDGGGSGGTVSGKGGGVLQNTSLEVVRPNTIAEIAKHSTPAVVKIETYSKSTQRNRSGSMFNDPFFDFFFGDQRGGSGNNSNREGTLVQTGTGSGFLFDPDGFILTNQHVLGNADEIRVFIEGYSDYFVAEQLGDSFDLDLAALKINGSDPFPYLQLGDADSMNVGDWVVAIGNPYGFDHTVTVGVLSAKERPITIPDSNGTRNYKNLLQTDASINPGNSGGPLLNLNGEVIGINTAVNAQAQGIGFAIPTSTISLVLDNLKNDTPIPKEPAPYIGVYVGNLDKETAEKLDFRGTDGALVSQVELRSPAHLAGLQNWDIITEVDGEKIKTSTALTDKVKTYKVGDTIKLKVFRLGQTLEISVTIGDRNAATN